MTSMLLLDRIRSYDDFLSMNASKKWKERSFSYEKFHFRFEKYYVKGSVKFTKTE